MGVHLTYYNYSNDAKGPTVVCFQKNEDPSFDDLAVAWYVIERCGRSNYHPFYFPMTLYINAYDSYGNHTPPQKTEPGDMFEMVEGESGNILQKSKEPATSCRQVQAVNHLERGAIAVNVYKSERLLARKRVVAPGQKAVFQLNPILYVGAITGVEAGGAISSAVLPSVPTKFSLLGIQSASIVMKGGGPGKNSKPFSFLLTDIKRV